MKLLEVGSHPGARVCTAQSWEGIAPSCPQLWGQKGLIASRVNFLHGHPKHECFSKSINSQNEIWGCRQTWLRERCPYISVSVKQLKNRFILLPNEWYNELWGFVCLLCMPLSVFAVDQTSLYKFLTVYTQKRCTNSVMSNISCSWLGSILVSILGTLNIVCSLLSA